MTQRESSPRRSRTIHNPSQSRSSSLRRSPTNQASGLNINKMVEPKNIVHIIEILGVVACAHHFWPKGITYGEQEDWEKAHRKRHEHGSKSKSKSRSGSGSGSSGSESRRRSTRDDRRYEDEYDERPRYSRLASSRY
ncbi:uncharacterized protein LY89DRAFT_389625 [Mollisia scopiformis]|uniref:Uncharacterized protein n=1 Tax=Mollisia scopiformis TaxID=149040 RepID=A0A194XPD6_MOLSC|nr:uncharacterized protein LY89DRAFT_389625 [Mollisia scopiformis]KUJ21934.1 hypothetical protein LY89DRAFT_389625 [Mollisia scopiformis]